MTPAPLLLPSELRVACVAALVYRDKCAFFALSIGLNKLPLLLGATLLPVADVFSSDLETSFSCPNESEPTDEGDLSVIPGQSD